MKLNSREQVKNKWLIYLLPFASVFHFTVFPVVVSIVLSFPLQHVRTSQMGRLAKLYTVVFSR